MDNIIMGGNIEDALENEIHVKEHGCYNYTKNGECSKCGACCGCFLPLSKKEIREIKRLVIANKIEPHKIPVVCMSIDLTCPFLDLKTHLCSIYDNRPHICRVFKCDKKPTPEDFSDCMGELINYDMWNFFE